jgi:Tol biopolymer transport system component
MYVVNPDGSGLSALTDDPGFLTAGPTPNAPAYNVDPAFSPDATQIVFTQHSASYDSNVLVAQWIGWDGDTATPLTATPWREHQPAFSPGGSQVVYVREGLTTGTAPNFRNHSSIRIVGSDGSGDRPVTDGSAWEMQPEFTPDGDWIVFLSDRARPAPTPVMDLYRVRPDGTDLRRITTTTDLTMMPQGFSVSPDGARIAWTDTQDIWLTEIAKPNDPTRLTEDPRLFESTEGVEFDSAPLFSPDGRWIAFKTTREVTYQGRDLWLMRTDGSDAHKLVGGPIPGGGGVFPEISAASWAALPPPELEDCDRLKQATRVLGTGDGERLTGKRGSDLVLARQGRDVATGGAGADCLFGEQSADRLNGGAARDFVVGGGGSDRLNGGPGRDELLCGPGRDVAYAETRDVVRGCERRLPPR